MPTERELPVFTQHYSGNRDLKGLNFPVFQKVHLVVGQESFIRFHQDLNEISLKMMHVILIPHLLMRLPDLLSRPDEEFSWHVQSDHPCYQKQICFTLSHQQTNKWFGLFAFLFFTLLD